MATFSNIRVAFDHELLAIASANLADHAVVFFSSKDFIFCRETH